MRSVYFISHTGVHTVEEQDLVAEIDSAKSAVIAVTRDQLAEVKRQAVDAFTTKGELAAYQVLYNFVNKLITDTEVR